MLKTLIRTTAIASLLVGGAALAQDANSGSMSSDSSASSSATGDMPMVGGAPMDPQKTIVENASQASNLTTLVAAVKAAGLAETLSGEGPFTVFAPTNEAFEKLPDGTVEDLLKPENKEKLTKILTYHVVPADVTAAAAMKMVEDDGGEHPAKTVEGENITLSTADGNLVITDAMGNKATVTQADVKQSNGMVHVIDTVLMPSE